MAYFDAFTANLFRTGPRGQRVITPFGRTVYAVAAADELRIKRVVAAFYALMLVVIITMVVKLGWIWAFAMVPISTAGFLALMALLVRSLTPLDIRAADLVPVTPGQALDASARATGRVTLWVLTLLSTAMTAAGIWAAVLTKGRLWWSATFFAACTVVFVVQLLRMRRS